MDQPNWLREAWAELGQRERAGAADNARVMAMYREVGHAGIAHDEVPWCAAFAGACLERAGHKSTRSLMARSYARWGAALEDARFGAIAVLSRGSDPALGHVGFVVGETDGSLLLLGGNQSNAVSVAPFDKSRVVALRWPTAAGEDGAVQPPRQATTGGAVSQHDTGGRDPGFARALANVLEMEGGFTDDPHDPGGPTNKGILLRELADWKGVTLDALNTDALKRELRGIDDDTVRAIYLARYWIPAKCAELPAALAFMHFDAAVNQGVGTAIRMLQQAVGTDADGEIGPLTRAAIAQTPVRKAVARYADIRRARYRALHHFWRFGRGWLNRVDKTLGRALALADGEAATVPVSEIETGDTDMAKASDKQAQQKWWGESMTIWGVLLTAITTVVPALGPVIGVDIPGDVAQQAGGDAVVAIQAIGGLVGTLMSIWGRMRANTPIGRREMRFKL